MSKQRSAFICQACGFISPKWAGNCSSCDAWNSFIAKEKSRELPHCSATEGRKFVLSTLAGNAEQNTERIPTGIEEFDRVLGGGFVAGSAILVGGDPGIGKSTLLLQAASAVAKSGQYVAYISGEESVTQVQLRARRLGLTKIANDVALGAETNVENILSTLSDGSPPALLIIDSIQTMWTESIDSAPGTVSQVRTSTQMLIQFSKNSGTTIVLVGHVTKDGQLAGPRTIEHIVDSVLYFEGFDTQQFRILRAIKNRFGPTREIGVFEMHESGLEEVKNPSSLFLGEHDSSNPGIAVFAGREGTRALLVEIQALTASSSLGTPRRNVVGWDGQRLSMILAVLETRCKIRFSEQDLYLNVAGGMRIQEPAADLAVAAAILSSLIGKPISQQCVYFGEIGLSGNIRKVNNSDVRLREAKKLGFIEAIGPYANAESKEAISLRKNDEFFFRPIKTLSELVTRITS